MERERGNRRRERGGIKGEREREGGREDWLNKLGTIKKEQSA